MQGVDVEGDHGTFRYKDGSLAVDAATNGQDGVSGRHARIGGDDGVKTQGYMDVVKLTYTYI